MVGSVVLLGAVLTLIDGAADAVKELFQSSELESEHVKNLLKIIGAAYIVDFPPPSAGYGGSFYGVKN